jgi:hypothetical protein
VETSQVGRQHDLPADDPWLVGQPRAARSDSELEAQKPRVTD